MSTTTARHPRSVGLRAVLAALAIAATAVAPMVAFADAIHPAKITVSAEPDKDDPTILAPSGDSGGYSAHSPQYGYTYFDDFDYASLGAGGGGGGG